MSSLKIFKEYEDKLHEELHNNITLLTKLYPTTREFNEVFKRNMFVKNNKAAFQQVIYYLLNTLDPELTKQKITSWPLFDMKQELKFRTEVLNYVNQLNQLYKEANIPHLMTSHLVIPGGFKFVNFMLKISELVLFQYLNMNVELKSHLLKSVKPQKNSTINNIMINNLNRKTSYIESNVVDVVNKFKEDQAKYQIQAETIITEQVNLNLKLEHTKKLLEDKKFTTNRHSSSIIQQSIDSKFTNISKLHSKIEQLSNVCTKCHVSLNYLLSGKCILEFKNEEFVSPDCVAHLVKTNNGIIELSQLFSALNVLVEHKHLEIPNITSFQINSIFDIVTEVNKKYAHYNKKLNKSKTHLLNVVEEFHGFQNCVKKNPVIRIGMYQDEEALAVSLKDAVLED